MGSVSVGSFRSGLGRSALRVGIAGLAVLAGCNRGAVDAAIVFDNVTLIDGTDRGAVPGMSVAIDGERIIAVAPTDKIRLGTVGTRIDGSGQYLIPGLWDMHVHLHGYRERALPLFLANGVTTIRDLSGPPATVGWIRQEVRAGRMLGPEVLMSGPVLDSPVLARPGRTGRLAVPTPEAAEAAVDSLSSLRVDLIKVHSLTPRAAYLRIMELAKERNLTVAGHIPDSISYREAIEAGQRTIEHALGIEFPNSSREEAITAWYRATTHRTIQRLGPKPQLDPIFRLRLAAYDSAAASYDSAKAAAFAELAASKPVWFDPTLVVMEVIARGSETAIRQPPELKYTPKEMLDYDDGVPFIANPTPAQIEAGRRKWEQIKLGMRELIRAGAKFVAGTDVPVLPQVPGFSLQHELELLVEAGLTPLGAIQAASRNAAAAMNLSDKGTIEVGKVADVVLVRADPLARISNTREVETVVARGRLLDRATLDRFLQEAEAFARQR